MSEFRYFEVRQREGVPVLYLLTIGFDRAAVNAFGQELFAYLDENRPPRLAVNLAAVTEIAAPTLAKLMMLDKRMTAYGGKLLVCEVGGSVREVMSLVWPAGFSTEVEPLSEADAVQRLKNWTAPAPA